MAAFILENPYPVAKMKRISKKNHFQSFYILSWILLAAAAQETVKDCNKSSPLLQEAVILIFPMSE